MTLNHRLFLLKLTLKKTRTERKKELIFLGILVLATSLSFGLGYITNRNTHRAPIIIKHCELTNTGSTR